MEFEQPTYLLLETTQQTLGYLPHCNFCEKLESRGERDPQRSRTGNVEDRGFGDRGAHGGVLKI